MAKTHLPIAWDQAMPACGKAAAVDAIIDEPYQIEEVTCPECAGIVISMTVSDRPKAGC